MPSGRYDAIVIGVGGVGSAALWQLARRGLRVLGIEQFSPGHDRGSSHGQTRVIRQAYFEHPNYVPMLLRAYELWDELERQFGKQLLFPIGLFQCGPHDGEVIRGVRASAKTHKLSVQNVTGRELAHRFPGFYFPSGYDVLFESTAGYLLVEKCVAAQTQAAVRRGALLSPNETVRSWTADAGGVTVHTDKNSYSAGRLVVTAGAWASRLLADLGLQLQVLRKALYWLRTRSDDYLERRDCPCFLYELPEGIFYGFPQIDSQGVKVAEHSGGLPIDDPATVDRTLNQADFSTALRFTDRHLPKLSRELSRHETCLYTMTPDGHFIVDMHPQHPQVCFAAGLSGHGFKFASVLGEVLAQMAVDGFVQLDVDFLSCRRPGLVMV